MNYENYFANDAKYTEDHRLSFYFNQGRFNRRDIYIHYTDVQGYAGIRSNRCISASPDMDRRGQAAKKGVYLAQGMYALNNNGVHRHLFLSETRYRLRGEYCFVFTFNHDPHLNPTPVSHGSHYREAIFDGNIAFHDINIIYDGKNPFLLSDLP